MIELKIKFDDKDLKLFKEHSYRFASSLDALIKRIAIEIRNTAVTNIQHGTRHGKIYKRRSISHQASAPGEWPKSDTGRLAASIRTDFKFLEAEIGSDVNYSQYLETGTRYMKARPWLQRSFDINHDNFTELLNDLMRRTFNL